MIGEKDSANVIGEKDSANVIGEKDFFLMKDSANAYLDISDGGVVGGFLEPVHEVVEHHVDVHAHVREVWLRGEGQEHLPLVQQSVQQVGVVAQLVGQRGIQNLQHHSKHLFNHTQVTQLEETCYLELIEWKLMTFKKKKI